MKKILNTLYVTSEDSYAALDGENVVVKREKQEMGRFPLGILENIILFTYPGASPALMGACAEKAIGLAFCTPGGRFLARVANQCNGNVLLRRKQYRIADEAQSSVQIARMMIFGKVFNSRWSIERTCRDHGLRVNVEQLKDASKKLKEELSTIQTVNDLDSLRGMEGAMATIYFDVFHEMILGDKEVFSFSTRSRRPPLNPVNALLSLSYTVLAHECASALEAVGLDSYVGFLHRDRPGRESLALDLMEELRPCMADRFVLTCINNRMFNGDDFVKMDSGAVLLGDRARKEFFKAWQERKQKLITHPFLNEKVQWGMVPHIQALLLARYLRGDLEEYPPFLWK